MDSSFDRGEVDRASLEATERLRQRLARERARERAREQESGRGRLSLLPWALAGGLLLFAGGMISSPWLEANVRARLPFASAPAPDPVAQSVETLAVRLAALEAAPADDASDEEADDTEKAPAEERLARTEAKVETSTDLLAREADRIDRLTADVAATRALIEADRARGEAAVAAVTAAADRSEALLAVMLARRALDEGRPLGAVEAPLRRAFEARYPGAVRDVALLGEAPENVETLRRDLATLGADSPGGGQSWWHVFTARVQRLVRPSSEPRGPSPQLAAGLALARGDVADAAAALRRLPQPHSAAVDRWLARADRLAAGEAGLRQLETAALIPPPKPEPVAPVPDAETP